MTMVTESLVRRVIAVVDAGLVSAEWELGPYPGRLSAAGAVCYAAGRSFGGQPSEITPAVRGLMRALNNANWSSPMARARGLRRLIVASLGSQGVVGEAAFARRVARLAAQWGVPRALRVAAQFCASEDRDWMLNLADLCAREPTYEHVWEARTVAHSVAKDRASSAAADVAAEAFWCINNACVALAGAGSALDRTPYDIPAYNAASNAGWTASAYAETCALAVAYTVAGTRNDAAARAAYDAALEAFADLVAQLLGDMGSPGAAYLHITDCDARHRAGLDVTA